MSEDAQVIKTEVLEILGEHDEGLTAQQIYDESRLAMSLAEITGALNRLQNSGQAVRGSDKRWRTQNQAEKKRARDEAQAKKAAAAGAAKRQQKPESKKPMDSATALETVQGVARLAEQKPKQAPGNFCPVDNDPCFDERCSKDGCWEIRTPHFEGRPNAAPDPDQPGDHDWLIRQLEEEADAAQVRLDLYAAKLGDEVLCHLVEMLLATTNALQAVRQANGK